MAYTAGATAAVAAQAAAAAAIKASGAIVEVGPDLFTAIVNKAERPLVVLARDGAFRPSFRYLTAYKGLIFFAKSPVELMLPGKVDLMTARKIWVP